MQKDFFSIEINPTRAFLWLSIIVLCIPDTFLTYLGIQQIANLIKYVGLAFALMYALRNNWFLKRTSFIIIIWLLWIVLTTAINGQSIYGVLRVIYPFVEVMILAEYLSYESPIGVIHTFSAIFSIELFINYITLLMGGLYDVDVLYRGYFFGLRVNINNIIIVAITFAIISAYLGRLKHKILLMITAFSGIYFVIVEEVSTSIVGLIVFTFSFLLLFALKRWPNQRKVVICIASLAFVAILAFALNPQTEQFSWFLEDFLGESLTLDGRTELWSSALEQLKGVHWVVGNGYASDYSLSTSSGFTATTAHSQYVNILFYFGIIGMAVYFIMYIYTIRKAMSVENNMMRITLTSALFSYLVMGIATTFIFSVYFYILYYVCILIDTEEAKDEIFEIIESRERSGYGYE